MSVKIIKVETLLLLELYKKKLVFQMKVSLFEKIYM